MNLQDLTQNHKNLPWLEDGTILLTRCGSKSHGTSTPTSDDDFKGVAVPPRVYFYGFSQKFEQAESKTPYDSVIYDVRKFCALAADCNPSIIEMLFTDPEDVVHITSAGQILRNHADMFMSKKAKYTFSGYAHSQLKRIKGHRAWLLSPPQKEPTRADFGLPNHSVVPKDQLAAAQAFIKKKLASWNIDFEYLTPASRIEVEARIESALAEMCVTSDNLWKNAGRAIGIDENFLHLMELERKYSNARDNWEQYRNWERSRNVARSALEAKYGYDTKHGMHLVRLMRMGWETLTYGKVWVRRPDAAELLEIRNGAWSYDRLIEYADEMSQRIDEAYETSKLPNAPDRKLLDALCHAAIDEHYLNG